MNQIPKFPVCDNCGKQILFGKFIARDGKFILVHQEYKDGKCDD